MIRIRNKYGRVIIYIGKNDLQIIYDVKRLGLLCRHHPGVIIKTKFSTNHWNYTYIQVTLINEKFPVVGHLKHMHRKIVY